MPSMWYAVRIIGADLIQIISCNATEKAANEQVERIRETVNLDGLKHRYMVWRSSNTNPVPELETHLNPHRKKKQTVHIDDFEEEYPLENFKREWD